MSRPSIRRSQLITTFGPGAIVNFDNGSYIGMAIDTWPIDNFADRVYDDRLQKRLGKKFFLQPPSNEFNEAGLPYRRFPRWLFCPHYKCRLLQPYEDWEARRPRKFNTSPLICPDHGAPLVPMNFLVACHKGHVDDFPWKEWVHKQDSTCAQKSPMKYKKGGSGAGLGGMIIECTGCGASRSMRGSFSRDAFKTHRCSGTMPWTSKRPAGCGERIVTVQRGGSNVYFPKVVSSIAIPSSYNDLVEEIKRTNGWMALSSLAMTNSELPDELKDKIIQEIANDVGRKSSEIKRFVNHLNEEFGEIEETSEEDYLFDEYEAFHGRYDSSDRRNRDFKVEDVTDEFNYSKYGIEAVKMVKAIREVRALVGFSRLKPLEQDEESPEVDSEKSELVSVSEKQLNWLPAVEVRGEGIFVTFDKEKLNKWSSQKVVQDRLALLNRNQEDACRRRNVHFSPITAKKVFLHTLAHMLIRQLSFECGYASASLRERIYCDEGDDNRMQGILIYTAAGDADGTLGGLVRQAKGDRFPKTFQSTLSNSTWCSNDPLCIESKGQGYESLNLAACYACCLLPETSCEMFNKFLDRALVSGSLDKTEAAFFKDLI